ncbi:MAG: 1,4-dihydroxy-6-naphthoate synthase [Planctomycetes bacterium]|nr:1,4-dihydroxy-6-naphthoate synthase [Planctomycetota bacterium]
MNPTTLDVGLSTCPNDTFLFAPLLDGRLDTGALELRLHLADVQELNEALAEGRLDVSKASFATALALSDRFGVLPVGAALGFGVGPVLLGRPGLGSLPRAARVLCPGEGTTATLLLRCLHPELEHIEQVRFDAIMPALSRGEADAGVCIHEGRFTYEAAGLPLLEDLGATWERVTGSPVPLGGLLARRDLPDDVLGALVDVLSRSLAAARAEPERALPVMRRHAQELDDEVLWRHVELYVNEHTTDLGTLGAHCLDELARRSGAAHAPPVLRGT